MKTNLNHHHNLAPNQMKLLTQSRTSAASSPPGFPVSGKVRPRALPVTGRVVVSPEQLHALRANVKLLCSAKPGHQGASCHQQGADALQGFKVSSSVSAAASGQGLTSVLFLPLLIPEPPQLQQRKETQSHLVTVLLFEMNRHICKSRSGRQRSLDL